jgi:hypothetical protein
LGQVEASLNWLPYKPTGELSESAFPGEAVLRPLLTVELEGSYGVANPDLLVDSGAEFTVVMMPFARRIGIANNLRSDWVERIRMGGSTHDAFLAHVNMTVQGDQHEVVIGFVKDWKWAGFSGILGQRGFFDRYGVLFDRMNRRFAVVPQSEVDHLFPHYAVDDDPGPPRFIP